MGGTTIDASHQNRRQHTRGRKSIRQTQKMGCKYGCHMKLVGLMITWPAKKDESELLRNRVRGGGRTMAKGEVMDVCVSVWWGGKTWRSWKELVTCYYMTFTVPHGCKIWCYIEQIRVKDTFPKCRKLSEWGPDWVSPLGLTLLKMYSKFKGAFFPHKDVGQKWLWSSPWERTQNRAESALPWRHSPGGQSSRWRRHRTQK